MNDFSNFISNASNVLWNSVLLFLLCGSGIWFTLTLGFVQIRRFGIGWNKLFGGMTLINEEAVTEGRALLAAIVST